MKAEDYIKNIYQSIKVISDKDFQDRIWVKGLGPEVSSYIEMMCTLYDDFNFASFMEKHNEFNLSNNLYEHLKVLDRKLNNYKEKDTDAEILNDPKWLEIIDYAKIVISLFEAERFGPR